MLRHYGPPAPTRPINGGGRGKWILIALALVAVIAISVAATVLALRRDIDTEATSSAPTGDTQFASANDTGPANIITEDPTCQGWSKVARDYAASINSVGWAERDPKVAAVDWTSAQRSMYETVSEALSHAVSFAPNLEKQTPHRVMRELYGQFEAAAHAWIDVVPNYDYKHNPVANVYGAAMSALSAICAAIDWKSIQPLAPLVTPPAPPTNPLPVSSPATEETINESVPICRDWLAAATTFDDDSAAWLAIDANIPASDWTPEQKAAYDAVGPVMTARADEIEALGRRSGDPIMEDFAVLAAQYLRAYVLAIPTYRSADNYVSDVTRFLRRGLPRVQLTRGV